MASWKKLLTSVNNGDWDGADLSLANGGTGSSLSDPNDDRILFWDDSAGTVTWLDIGSNLSVSGTTLNATDTNTNTTYTAGTGMSLSGTEFSCTVTDTNTTYSAGTGLTLSSTTFSISSGAALSNLGGGSGSTFLKKDGTWATPTDTNTTYTAGTGMSLSGTEFSCTVTDTNTTYSAGTGLNLSSTTFSLATGAALSNLGGGSGSTFLKKDGTWATPSDTNTTYSAGTGMSLSGTTFSCTVTDTNTTYSAGSGLDLSGTTFSVESDLRSDVYKIGRDTNDYYAIETTTHDWYLDGVLDMRLENDGDLHCDGDVIAYSTTTASDRRLKSDIMPLGDNLRCLLKLEPVKFDWAIEDRGEDIGFIAQDVQKIIPDVVKEVNTIGKTKEFLNDDTKLTVDYAKLVPVLVGAIQELNERIEYLEAKV